MPPLSNLLPPLSNLLPPLSNLFPPLSNLFPPLSNLLPPLSNLLPPLSNFARLSKSSLLPKLYVCIYAPCLRHNPCMAVYINQVVYVSMYDTYVSHNLLYLCSQLNWWKVCWLIYVIFQQYPHYFTNKEKNPADMFANDICLKSNNKHSNKNIHILICFLCDDKGTNLYWDKNRFKVGSGSHGLCFKTLRILWCTYF